MDIMALVVLLVLLGVFVGLAVLAVVAIRWLWLNAPTLLAAIGLGLLVVPVLLLLVGFFFLNFERAELRRAATEAAQTSIISLPETAPPRLLENAQESDAADRVDASAAEPSNEAVASRPAWVEMQPRRVGDAYQMAVTVGPYATRLECDARLPEVLQSALDQFVENYLGREAVDRVDLPNDYLREALLSDQWEEPVETSFGQMTQLHALLEFDPEIKQRIDEAWRNVIIARRLINAATITGFVLAGLGMVFVYLKLTPGR